MRTLLQPQEMRQTRLRQAAVTLIGHVRLDGGTQLRARRRRRLLFCDPAGARTISASAH